MIRHKELLAVPLTLAIFAVTACGPAPRAAPDEPDGRPAAADGDDALIAWARETIVGRCMTAAGFEYQVRWRAAPETARSPYVNDDVAFAQTHGFAADEAMEGDRSQDSNERYYASLDAERKARFDRALWGDPAELVSVEVPEVGVFSTARDGCDARSRTELYGDLADWLLAESWESNLDGRTVARVMDRPDYQDAVADWAACVSAAGFDAATPGELREWASRNHQTADSATAEAREIAAAVAEAECARSSGLRVTAEELHARTRAEILQEDAAMVSHHTALRRHAVELARAMLDT